MIKEILRLEHIQKFYGNQGNLTKAISDISFSVNSGEFVGIMGASGSGKTTLLNIVGALDTPTSGSVTIGGQDVCRLSDRARENLRRTKVGFVFQSVSLIPTMNAFQNVEFSLRLAGVKKGRQERVEECLKMVGLGNRMHHMPMEMSGGEQQRVAIARAIAHRPQIVLADEPTAELDSAMAAEVARLFQEMTRTEGVTIVMTTHDTGLMDAGDMVIELANGKQIAAEH